MCDAVAPTKDDPVFIEVMMLRRIGAKLNGIAKCAPRSRRAARANSWPNRGYLGHLTGEARARNVASCRDFALDIHD